MDSSLVTCAITASRDRPFSAIAWSWSYEGPSLAPRLDQVGRVRLIREHVAGGSGDAAFSWTADRGLVLTGADGRESLLLALSPEGSEQAAFLPAVGFYRALVDPAAPEIPGATVRDLLGYGDREGLLEIKVEVAPL